jgi:hypothetical protein
MNGICRTYAKETVNGVLRDECAVFDEAITALNNLAPNYTKYRVDPCTSYSAYRHSKYQIVNNNQVMTHTGSSGIPKMTGLADRLQWSSYFRGAVAENIADAHEQMSNSAKRVIVDLIVDWWVKDRGHRANLFNPVYDVVGLGIFPHLKANGKKADRTTQFFSTSASCCYKKSITAAMMAEMGFTGLTSAEILPYCPGAAPTDSTY